ncbi:MAG: flagellar basal-body rod protein FlgB [Bacteroidota bacterium]|nr:flagellar basal-body rod protein FlgB [Bacteroidota bacterium]
MIYRSYLFRKKLPLMNRALDAYALRQSTTSKNIANATSPFYRPEQVKFEEFFQDQEVVETGQRTDDLHIPIGKPDESNVEGVKEDTPIPAPEVFFSGETHVNIDKEMSKMAENQIRFRFGTNMVKKYFTGMSSAIRGINT